MLDREEYIEQAYLFRVLGERILENLPLQEILAQVKEELLSTTRLPLAIDFMLAELRHSGAYSPAMARLPHYFTGFQTYVVQEAENERGRFDMRVALEILRADAGCRVENLGPQALFMFQFESLCRNRLRYDKGLAAIAADPAFPADWREWILNVRRQMGLVDFADLLYQRSELYSKRLGSPPPKPILFGEKEGKIALANRGKDPLYLFAALQRHLGYPTVPRPKRPDEAHQVLPQILRRLERLESRLKLLEEEEKGGIDLARFYQRPDLMLPGEHEGPDGSP